MTPVKHDQGVDHHALPLLIALDDKAAGKQRAASKSHPDAIIGGSSKGAKPDKAMSEVSERRGLWKLMLKLPALRGELQVLSARNATLLSLCEAYNDASSMLDLLRRNGSSDIKLIGEYQGLCTELEEEVIKMCVSVNQK